MVNNKCYVKYVFGKFFQKLYRSIKESISSSVADCFCSKSMQRVLEQRLILEGHLKGNQRTFGHLKGTHRVPGELKGTQRALKGHSKGTQRALGHLKGTQSSLKRHLDTQSTWLLKHLGTLRTRTLQGHFGTKAIKELGHSTTRRPRSTLFSRLHKNCIFHTYLIIFSCIMIVLKIVSS